RVRVRVQSGFSVYVPVMLTWSMLPFWLNVAVAVVPPLPSKVCAPISENGPAYAGGAVMNPVDVYAKVPRKVSLEHPLSSAFAVGAMARANAVIAAAVKVLAMMLRFMMVSFALFMPNQLSA